MLIGLIALLVGVMSLLRWAAHRIHAHLSARGKAMSRAVGEIAADLAGIALGILAWHKWQSGDTATGVTLAAFLLWALAKKAFEGYARQSVEVDTNRVEPIKK